MTDNAIVAHTRRAEMVLFEPERARESVTAHEAKAMVEARKGNVDVAIEHADKALAIQRAFVLWWDAQPRQHGDLGNRSVTQFPRLADVAPDLDKMTVSRWRTALVVADDPSDTSKYEAELEKVNARIRKLCGLKSADPTAKAWTGEIEWYTPSQYIESARVVMGGIDLDPASNPVANQTIGATTIYTIKDDGLAQPWSGRVWLNPPYKMPAIKLFCEKVCASYSAGDIEAAIVLTNNATDTSWWHLMTAVAQCVCFTAGRISFYNEDGEHSSPTNGQNFHYFGSNVDAFRTEFAQHGRCMVLA